MYQFMHKQKSDMYVLLPQFLVLLTYLGHSSLEVVSPAYTPTFVRLLYCVHNSVTKIV